MPLQAGKTEERTRTGTVTGAGSVVEKGESVLMNMHQACSLEEEPHLRDGTSISGHSWVSRQQHLSMTSPGFHCHPQADLPDAELVQTYLDRSPPGNSTGQHPHRQAFNHRKGEGDLKGCRPGVGAGGRESRTCVPGVAAQGWLE